MASRVVAVVIASGLLCGCPVRRDQQRDDEHAPSPRATPPIVAPALGQPPYGIVLRVAGDPMGQEIARVLRRDLELSGQFAPSSAGSSRRADLRLPGARRSSTAPGTQVLLHAAMDATEIAVEASVYFAAHGSADPAGTIRVRAADARRAAHRLGNELYRIHTERPGPFLSRIAFVAPRAGDPASRQIFVIDFAGGAPVRISSAGRHNILPSWSARGDLVFTSFARGNPDLYVVAAQTRQMQLVSSRPGLNTGGAFAPDGRTIALTLTARGNQDVHLIGLDGTIRRRLTHHPKIDVSPTWSPDGTRLAFVSQRRGVPQIFVLALAAGRPARLTRGGSDNQEPDWCARPGSQQIAYTSRRRGTYQIFVVNAQTGATRQLTRGGRHKQSPSWSPDCQLVVYAVEGSGLWTSNADGSDARQLYRGTAKTPDWSS